MNNRLKLFLPLAFFFIMLGLMVFGLGRDPNKVSSVLIFRPLPEFALPDLHDASVSHNSESIKGGIYLINFWATWCPPCYVEHPYLMELSRREQEVTLIGVNYDDPDQEAARGFLEERGNPFEYVITDLGGRLGIDFGVTGPPETFLVDGNGVIRYRHIGVIDDRVWNETLAPLIAQIKQ